MTYVRIDDGSLEGLGSARAHTNAPRWRPVRGRDGVSGMAGLGASTDADGEARAVLLASFSSFIADWRKTLDAAISAIPVYKVMLLSAKSNLSKARTKLSTEVMPIAKDVIEDRTIPYEEVARRVESFLTEYFKDVKAQMNIAEQATRRATMAGQLDQFLIAFRSVVKQFAQQVGVAAKEVGQGLGTGGGYGVWVLGGLAALALASYSWRAFR